MRCFSKLCEGRNRNFPSWKNILQNFYNHFFSFAGGIFLFSNAIFFLSYNFVVKFSSFAWQFAFFHKLFLRFFVQFPTFSTLTSRAASASSSLTAVEPALVVVALGVPLCPRDHLLPPFSVGVGPHGGASTELGCHDAVGHRTATFHPHTHTRPREPRCCWQNGSSCSRKNPDRDEVKFQLFLPNRKFPQRTEKHTHVTQRE